ncbi:DUF5694 domain-containing protein [Terrimonas sp. NA20]|uniref:DUF5694 domain-containing protein n=1 Tax=Terrimonas ginsenosidimutans TaxID=2908004 RepID=A0ABS9KN05_9BACT|nr:DUF5694 domain-containing protein [Terrimonas ginsenosidimutans]MCG2613699.1 DUF5694 domain-containing protein [Terrimonas ginsenosidimutans]
MKQILLIATLLMILLNATYAQKIDWKKMKGLDPDLILHEGDRKPTEVLLLGTYHFDYPNLDVHVTDSSLQVDILSARKQKEVKELVSVIERFKPTRIYIEATRQSFHDSLYNEYLQDRFTLGRNEIYQLAYRVGKDMKINKVHAVDASSFIGENAKKYTWIDSMDRNMVLVDSVRDKYWNRLYSKFYTISDTLEKNLTLLENFILMAEPQVLKRMQGNYFTGGFNTQGNEGPDFISMWWFSRNLRIFNNILKTKPASEDRILVLFGNGHMPTLKHCFESSPEFKVVELKSLLK